MKWKTKEGKLLDIKEMTSDHIKNCISLLEKRIDSLEPYYGDTDGDMSFGIMLTSGFQMQIAEDNMKKAIKQFEKELKRRKL